MSHLKNDHGGIGLTLAHLSDLEIRHDHTRKYILSWAIKHRLTLSIN